MTTKSMKQRIRRVATQAAQKKGATRRSSRQTLIAKLEKEAQDTKSKSFDEQPGGGTGSADDQFDRKKNLPKSKGDDPKTDYDWEQGEGYPHASDQEKSLGSGGDDPEATKQKQQALDEAAEENRKNTSEMEPMTHGDPSRPRPKLSSVKRRKWRRKKMAQLKASLSKTAFNPEGDPEMKKMFSDMAAEDTAPKAPAPKPKGVGSSQQLKPLLALSQNIGKGLSVWLPKLQEANSDLEMAITGGKIGEIKGHMGKLMTTFQGVMRNVLVPHGSRMQKLLGGLRQASVKDKRFKVTYTRLARMDEELSRSRTLIRMAAGHVRI